MKDESTVKKPRDPREHHVWITAACCMAVFGVIATVYHHFNELYIEDLKGDISRLEKYESKYTAGIAAQEQLKLLEARFGSQKAEHLEDLARQDTRFQQLKAEYQELKDANWSQKYESEIIRNNTLVERHEMEAARLEDDINRVRTERDNLRAEKSRLQARIDALPVIREKTVGDGMKAFEDLLAEKAALKETVAILENSVEEKDRQIKQLKNELTSSAGEVAKLRELVVNSGGDTFGSLKFSPVATAADIDRLCAAIEGISSDVSSEAALVQQVDSLNKYIKGEDFVRILRAAAISSNTSKGDAIIRCRKVLIYPLSAEATRAMLSGITSSSTRQKVSASLAKAAEESSMRK